MNGQLFCQWPFTFAQMTFRSRPFTFTETILPESSNLRTFKVGTLRPSTLDLILLNFPYLAGHYWPKQRRATFNLWTYISWKYCVKSKADGRTKVNGHSKWTCIQVRLDDYERLRRVYWAKLDGHYWSARSMLGTNVGISMWVTFLDYWWPVLNH